MSRQAFIGNTDKSWFDFLRAQPSLPEVNFWQPGSLRNFKAIQPGAPFFLRLKAPYRAIAGMGFFSRYVQVPVAIAWDTFGVANGAASLADMRRAIGKYRKGKDIAGSDEIGSILLFHPVFFPESQWVEQPDSWKDNIVSGAGIDIDGGEGARIYETCKQRMLWLHENTDVPTDSAFVQSAKYGLPYEVKPRLGQGAFRLAVTEAYGRACAVSGEHSLPVLDAAHIQPFGGEGDHRVQNGLLLRTDIHRLFDKGYVTVTPELEFVVSKRLQEEFSNGKIYYALQGKQVSVPQRLADRPEKAALIWHNENRFEKFG